MHHMGPRDLHFLGTVSHISVFQLIQLKKTTLIPTIFVLHHSSALYDEFQTFQARLYQMKLKVFFIFSAVYLMWIES